MRKMYFATIALSAVACGDVSNGGDIATSNEALFPVAIAFPPFTPVSLPPPPPTSPLVVNGGTLVEFDFLAPTNGASSPYPVVVLKNGDSGPGATTANTMPDWQELLRDAGYAVVPVAINTAASDVDFPAGVDAVVDAIALRTDVDTSKIALLGHSGGASAVVMVAGAEPDPACRAFDPAWFNSEVDAVIALSPKPPTSPPLGLCTGFDVNAWGAMSLPSMSITGGNDIAGGLSSQDMFNDASVPVDRRKQSLLMGPHPNPVIGGHGFFPSKAPCGGPGICEDMWTSMALRAVDFLDYTFYLDADAYAQLERVYEVPFGHPNAVTYTLTGVNGASAPAPMSSSQDVATIVGLPGTTTWTATCAASGASSGPRRPLGTVGLDECPGGAPNSNCLLRVTVDTDLFPNATCNDGTPGTFYIRPGRTDPNKWVIHLQGGGSCQDGDRCLERWCGQQNGGNYRANKMSSDWNADGVSDLHNRAENGGIFNIGSANNKFRGWTHVFVYYCSSDSWLGQADDVNYSSSSGVNYTMNNRGHHIVSAVRDMLRVTGAAVPWKPDNYDNAPTTMPDLDNATHIVFSGTSAGAKGAIVNADWFLTPFTSSARTFLVIDGNLSIGSLVRLDLWIDEDGDGDGDIKYWLKRIEEENDSWRSGFYSMVNAFADESCISYYATANGLDRRYFCAHFSSLLQLAPLGPPLIETDTFIRLDMQDPVKARRYIEEWPNGERMKVGQFGGRNATRDDFTLAMHASLDFYFKHSFNNVTGVFGPRCSKHVGLAEDPPFAAHGTFDTDSTVTPPVSIAGTDANFHDALWDWLNIGGATTVSQRVLDTSDVNDPANTTDAFTSFSFRNAAGAPCN